MTRENDVARSVMGLKGMRTKVKKWDWGWEVESSADATGDGRGRREEGENLDIYEAHLQQRVSNVKNRDLFYRI